MTLSPLRLETEMNYEKPKRRLFLKLKEAILVCEKALKNNPQSLDASYNLGKCYMEIRDYNSVQKIIDRLRFEGVRDFPLYVLEGHMYLTRGYLVEAYRCFLMAYEKITKCDAYLSYGIALLFESIEDYRLARKWYTLLLKYDIELFKYFEVMFRIGISYKKENRLVDGREVFRALLGISKSEAFICDIKLQLAHIHERMNDNATSLSILDSIKGTYKKKVPLYRIYAWIYYKEKQHEKVIEMENNTDCVDPYIYYLIARSYLIKNDYKKAIELLDTSISLDKDMFMAYNTLGVVYFRLKQLDKSVYYFKKVIKTRPLFLESVENLRIVESGDFQQRIKEVYPDLARTRYLDSQVIFNENIYYATLKENDVIQEMSTLRMESL